MINTANLCIFEGRVAKDAQVTTVQGPNGPFNKARFTIAVDRVLTPDKRQKVKNGDTSIVTSDFIPCSVTGNGLVDIVQKYCPVGKAIRVIGSYSTYQSTGQNGQTQYGHNFEISDIGFTTQDSKRLQQSQQNGGGYQQQNNYQQNQYQQQNGGYQQQAYQAPANNYQQQPQQQPAQAMNAPQGNFAMYDESDSPF